MVLALCKFAGVNPRLFRALVSHFGALEKVFRNNATGIRQIGINADETASLAEKARSSLPLAEEYYAELTQRDIRVVTQFDPDYPQLLFELNDPPPMLYLRGKLPDNDRKSVTVTGTKNAGNQGIDFTVSLAQRLCESGVQVASSLAKGIDAAVHLGCKAANSNSFAVHDSGFDHVDQTEQVPLAIDITQEGGLLTEYSPEQHFRASHTGEFNRLLVGMTQAVIVTEFYRDSSATLDLIKFCRQIGKLTFLMFDPATGPLSDQRALDVAGECGVIPIAGLDNTDMVVNVLV